MRKSLLHSGQLGAYTDSNESGQAVLEFSLVLPVLLLIITGICSFGVYLSQYLVLTNGVTIAAQQLALNRGQTTDPCALTASTFQNASPTLKTTSLGYTIVLNGTTYTGAPGKTGFSCSSSSTSTGAAGNLVQGTTAQVTITYPCTLAIYGKNLLPNCTLTAQTAEAVQ